MEKEGEDAMERLLGMMGRDPAYIQHVSEVEGRDWTLFTKPADETGCHFKVEGRINAKMYNLQRALTDTNKITRMAWDNEELEDISCREKFSDTFSIIEAYVKMPAIVSNRRFLSIQYSKKIAPDTWAVVHATPKTPEMYPSLRDDVVDVTGISGVVVRHDLPEYDSVTISMVANIHPGGWIPPWIASFFTGPYLKRLEMLEKAAKLKAYNQHKVID